MTEPYIRMVLQLPHEAVVPIGDESGGIIADRAEMTWDQYSGVQARWFLRDEVVLISTLGYIQMIGMMMTVFAESDSDVIQEVYEDLHRSMIEGDGGLRPDQIIERNTRTVHCPGCAVQLHGNVALRGACLDCYPDLPEQLGGCLLCGVDAEDECSMDCPSRQVE